MTNEQMTNEQMTNRHVINNTDSTGVTGDKPPDSGKSAGAGIGDGVGVAS